MRKNYPMKILPIFLCPTKEGKLIVRNHGTDYIEQCTMSLEGRYKFTFDLPALGTKEIGWYKHGSYTHVGNLESGTADITFSCPGYDDLKCKAAMTHKIGIFGLKGSGKTVFTTVWAHGLTNSPNPSCCLISDNRVTADYVDEAWNTLYHKGEWVESSAEGTMHDLSWDFCLDGVHIPLRLVDVSGQHLQDLFSMDRHRSPNELETHEMSILSYLRSCTVVAVIVNLRDFVRRPSNYLQRRNAAYVLESAINMYAKDRIRQHINIVFTAYDEFRSDIEQNYGTIEGFVQKELTTLYNAVANSPDDVRYQAVAPVNETVSKDIPGRGESTFPKAGFSSYGLEEFTRWLCIAIDQPEDTTE